MKSLKDSSQQTTEIPHVSAILLKPKLRIWLQTTVKMVYRQRGCVQLLSSLHLFLNSTDRSLPGIQNLLEHRVLTAILCKTESPPIPPSSNIQVHYSQLLMFLFSEQAEKQGSHHPVGKTPMKSVIIHSYVKNCEEERKCDKLIHSNKERL